jgi:hypothetical protein
MNRERFLAILASLERDEDNEVELPPLYVREDLSEEKRAELMELLRRGCEMDPRST